MDALLRPLNFTRYEPLVRPYAKSFPDVGNLISANFPPELLLLAKRMSVKGCFRSTVYRIVLSWYGREPDLAHFGRNEVCFCSLN